MDTNFEKDEIRMPNDEGMTNKRRNFTTPHRRPFNLVKPFNFLTFQALLIHCPNGVITSVPAGGLNSNVDGAIGVRVWFEYFVTIRSPFGSSMSVRSTRNSLLIRRSSF